MTVSFSELLVQIKESGVSQIEISERAKISQSTLSRFLSGKTDNPHQGTLERVKKALDDILTGRPVQPKVFISYSWSHQATVKDWAEQLISDGIEVVLDIYDLKEGQDMYAFMERMVSDETVTHVLIVCDQTYAKKADTRKFGVGKESQIISKEVYDSIEQSKFIPIVAQFNEAGEPCLPTYLKSRIWIDFSTPEATNENWEKLVRALYGKPIHEKPKLGKAPLYIRSDSEPPPSPASRKLMALKQAILNGKPGVPLYRREFLDACIEYAESLRIRVRPEATSPGEKIVTDFAQFKKVRNHIVDWILLEGTNGIGKELEDSLIRLLEQLRGLISRPKHLNSWNDCWQDVHSLFVHETFLYIVAALIKVERFESLHEILFTHYLVPEPNQFDGNRFETFRGFYGRSDHINSYLSPEGKNLRRPEGELFMRQADRSEIPFSEVIQAELLVLLIAYITEGFWFPHTYLYASNTNDFPFFIRATQNRGFQNLATITGFQSAEDLRNAAIQGEQRLQIGREFMFSPNLLGAMNIENLDTIGASTSSSSSSGS